MDLVQSLDRRGFLAVAAAIVAASHASGAGAQTLIADTPAMDTGVGREAASEAAPALVHRAASPVAQPIDWKASLLHGDRSIVVRRDGGPVRVRYCTKDGLLDREGYAHACYLMRDVRAGKMFTMDPRLLDVLCGIQRWGEHNGKSSVFRISSGFRSRETNDRTEGAARNSLHLYGRAVDIIPEGFSSGLLGAMVREFNDRGGTGIYLARGFVHVDTGAARTWVSTGRR